MMDHGSKMLFAPIGIPGLELDHAQKGARIVMAWIELQDERELFARAPGVAAETEQLGELETDVVKLRAESKSPPEFVNCVFGSVQIEVSATERPVQVRDLSTAVGIV